MDYLPFFFNTILLLFWVRLWSSPDREFYFNPFLSGTVRLTDSVLVFLRPVFNLPDQVAALLVLLFAAAFKTIALVRLHVAWLLSFGVNFAFAPAAAVTSWKVQFVYSVLQFASFLFKFWSVYLIVKLITPQHHVTRATEALDFFARPFSRLPLLLQPVVLALLHFALAFAATRIGVLSIATPLNDEAKVISESPFLAGPFLAQFLKISWLAALSMADGLEILIRTLFVLIIGNLGAAIFQMQGLLIICNEGVELLMGRFARSRSMSGMGLDFTPLIFFFVVDMLYRGICIGLENLITMPFFN